MSGSTISSSARSEVVPAALLDPHRKDQMWQLFAAHFNACRQSFEADLAEKDWVLVLESEGQLQGFSTMMRLDFGGQRLVFSGDTIVTPAARGSARLAQLWAEHVFGLVDREGPVYWFLITSGYRTYRLLPLFFQDFYPRFDRPTPARLAGLLEGVARHKFGSRYRDGVVVPASPTPLREPEVPQGRRRDPHVGFFLERNPGHRGGHELACLARVERANLTPAGRRVLA
ncbi:MAG: hypothetical protein KC910_08275 [Candidatus Eremiobacteraeota bacterium]|nr:hypothetical protein [Candidatus Eremiobacteraeota bacterium]